MDDWLKRLFAAQRRQWETEHGDVFAAPKSFRDLIVSAPPRTIPHPGYLDCYPAVDAD